MKGFIFTEFMEMVEQKFGFVMANEMIEEGNPASEGVYNGIGTYPVDELVTLIGILHQKTRIPVADLIETFGRHLFRYFVHNYSHFFEKESNTFDFLARIEGYIHVEVKKLYHDAELPLIETTASGNRLVMVYRSKRKLYKLAEGLIKECAAYYGENIVLHTSLLEADGSAVKFELVRN